MSEISLHVVRKGEIEGASERGWGEVRESKKKKKKMKEIKPRSCNGVIKLGAVRGSPSGLLLLSEIIYNSVGREGN